MSTPHNSDPFEAKLDEAMNALLACQKEHALESCYGCEKTIGCELRGRYVRTVYESMSKGETGGFDF